MIPVPGSDDLLLFLDSNSATEIGGRVGPDSAQWLRETLATSPKAALTVFIHHPPVAHGMAHFNNIGMYDSRALMAILSAHPGGARHIFFGHIHIPLTGTTRDGIGFTAGRGCTHQFWQDFQNPAPDWIAGVPNYAVITITPEQLSCHGVDTLDAQMIAAATFCAGPQHMMRRGPSLARVVDRSTPASLKIRNGFRSSIGYPRKSAMLVGDVRIFASIA